jgi:hypothetical protein
VTFAARPLDIFGVPGGGGGGQPFTPVTHYYQGVGAFTETIPVGATKLTAEVGGPGGGGGGVASGGAGSGALAQRTFTLTPANWGQTFAVTITAGGTPGNQYLGWSGNTGVASTISNGSFPVGVAMVGGPGIGGNGNGPGSPGGTASGGDTNISGVAGQANGYPGGPGVVGRAIVSGAGGHAAIGDGNPGPAGGNGAGAFLYS